MLAIVEKGLAYDAEGSVYMSIDAFKAAGFDYRKVRAGLLTLSPSPSRG